MFRVLALSIVGFWIAAPGPSVAQQVADPEFQPVLEHPTYPQGMGPVVAVDEAHHNFHTRDGRYSGFTRLLRADGYKVVSSLTLFDGVVDESIDVLVIANALHASNLSEWQLPTPSAFTPQEIEVLAAWVSGGGSLFLIADHMPFPGAAGELALRFGVEMTNGFAFATDKEGQLVRGPMAFTSENGRFGVHPIMIGNSLEERVTQVASFTGQAFRIEETLSGWNGLVMLPAGTVSLEPEVAWQFDDDTKRRDVGGWYQGASANWGQGV